MKQVKNYGAKEFTYDTEEERKIHIAHMNTLGWREMDGFDRMLKLDPEGDLVFDPDEEYEYQWYARFEKNYAL